METKKCFKCGRILPLDDFYRHPKMKDGHLNKCIDCTKRDMYYRQIIKYQDSIWLERERERCRKKARTPKTENAKVKEQAFRGLRSTKRFFQKKGYVFGADEELHHWNYNLIHSVIVLPRRLHHRLHSLLRFVPSEGIYYKDDHRLGTIEEHLAVVKEACDYFGFDFSQIRTI